MSMNSNSKKKVHETLCLFESLYFKNHFLYTHFETFFSHFCNFSWLSKNSCLVGKFASRQKRDMQAQSVRNLTCSVNCLPKAGEVFIVTDWLVSLLTRPLKIETSGGGSQLKGPLPVYCGLEPPGLFRSSHSRGSWHHTVTT
jgi:hypothetical protein